MGRSAAVIEIDDDVRELSGEEAQRLWAAVLARQGLAGGRKLRSAAEAAELGLGLHAARLPSPFTTLLARLGDPASALALFEPPTTVSLTTVRCMRKTLHILPIPLAGIAHTATRYFRERDALRLAHNAKIAPATLGTLIDQLLQLMTVSGPLGHREMESSMLSERWPVLATRVALRLIQRSRRSVGR